MGPEDMTPDEVLLVGDWLVRRAMRLWPADPDFASTVLAATSCDLMGVPGAVSDDPKVTAGMRQMLTLEGGEAGTSLQIGTIGGVIQVAQMGLSSDADVIERLVTSAESKIDDRRWHCPLCRRIFPESYGPDHCPDCGSRLIRLRSPKPGEQF
jgi:hypothetical protein